ncbi:hypothetical protein BH23VER1_BH23VER1_06560 [soil metagenome]
MKNSVPLAILVTIGLSAIGVLADYFLKRAGEVKSPFVSRYFFLGLVTYASTAPGWVYVMRNLKLAQVGVFYSVSTVLMLCALGAIVFKETFTVSEIIGVGLAIISLCILARVA